MYDSYHLSVKALIRNREGKLLLLKAKPDYVMDGEKAEGYWDIPGGRVKRGSDVSETVRREVKEETGIETVKSYEELIMVISKIRIKVEGGDVGLILLTLLCEVGDVDAIKLSADHTEYQWTDPFQASKLLEFKYPPEFTRKVESLGK
jgi:8-oxo-dGTP pyrophosphatase MutT (NUDIX family)